MNLFDSLRRIPPLCRIGTVAGAIVASLLLTGAPAIAAKKNSPVTLTAPSPAALSKLSGELQALYASPATLPDGVAWANMKRGQLLVKVLIVATSPDAELTGLRASVLAGGGSVFYNYLAVRAVAAMVPAQSLGAIAARADVVNIAPNHLAQRQASLLQAGSGLGDAAAGAPGMSGDGVAIAILDSGLDYRHRNLTAADGSSPRARRRRHRGTRPLAVR